jgi:mannose-6-phosphate isomerase-like protein (cupin superfamily)
MPTSRKERGVRSQSNMEPFSLGSDEGKILPHIGRLIATATQTDGAFEVIEYTGPAAPPAHVHRMRDEGFYILDGSFSFTLAERDVEVGVGSFIFVPRGTRHGFTVRPGGRALLFIAPAGLEGFFEELGRGLAAGRSGAEIRDVLADRYDSTPV